MDQTLYWHDYETFGLDTRRDRPVQFAGIRTDLDLNIIEDPLEIYCKPSPDYLPNPEACLVTGITPQLAIEKGSCEAEFIALIHQQISRSGTCTAGYNNIRFDDEVTRNTLYRNFYDPYAREWQNGNSRWDLIDLVRAARALRPDGINWPDREDGKPDFRLEKLTVENGLIHASAHNALSDVQATIDFARLIRQAQFKLYQFIFEHRSKSKVSSLLKLGSMTPILHVSGMYPSDRGCIAVVLPLCKHPTNNNGVLVYDLSVDPDPMLSLSVEQIHDRVFTATENLPEGAQRIPLKNIHINKCPVVAPLSVLRSKDAERLEIDLAVCRSNQEKIQTCTGLKKKLSGVFRQGSFAQEKDPDLMIYNGGFFCDKDKAFMETIRSTPSRELAGLKTSFVDPRLPEMLFRYRARNFPETLNKKEKEQWKKFCLYRLIGKDAGGGMVIKDYLDTVEELKNQQKTDKKLLDALEEYARGLDTKV